MTPAQSLLRAATGLSLSKSVVDRAIKNRMAQTDIADADAYLQQMTPDEMTALVELVVVPESWLFRDPQAFAVATEFVKLRLARGAKISSNVAPRSRTSAPSSAPFSASSRCSRGSR